jgi:hypothetical protein
MINYAAVLIDGAQIEGTARFMVYPRVEEREYA